MEEASLQATGDIPSMKQVFFPQETLDHPFDVTLVVEGGREFKAHRRVLSEASPFFERLFNSDMRESHEGIVRLEMLTELCLRDILEFIYTGDVQISAGDNSQELIAMADYMFLPHLKIVAGKVLVEKLNVSNAISTCYLAQRHRCEELISNTKTFILTNFTAVAKTVDFLNLSSEEVKLWISSDEIDVSAEEDVFKIILTWIDREKSERKKYFAELFREVRLIYVSPDYLHSDIVTNDLVNDNEGCLDLVKHAMKIIDSKNYHSFRVKPRNSLEIPVVVVCVKSVEQEDQFLFYYPREDKWSHRFRGTVPIFNTEQVISSKGKLYFISPKDNGFLRYDSFSNCWTSLPYEEQRRIRKVFLRNEDEIWALMSQDQTSCSECVSLSSRGIDSPCGKRHLSFITEYKPESNSWEDISSFDLGSRKGICIVAKDNFIYFLGGSLSNPEEILTNADRYDLSTSTWNKIADMNYEKSNAFGACAYGKVFIVGGYYKYDIGGCEVYHETTDEWQFIASMRASIFTAIPTRAKWLCGMVCADRKLYALNMFISERGLKLGCQECVIQCYDPDKDEWNVKTRPEPLEWQRDPPCRYDVICSMKAFKGSKGLQQASIPDLSCSFSQPEILGQSPVTRSDKVCKCTII